MQFWEEGCWCHCSLSFSALLCFSKPFLASCIKWACQVGGVVGLVKNEIFVSFFQKKTVLDPIRKDGDGL